LRIINYLKRRSRHSITWGLGWGLVTKSKRVSFVSLSLRRRGVEWGLKKTPLNPPLSRGKIATTPPCIPPHWGGKATASLARFPRFPLSRREMRFWVFPFVSHLLPMGENWERGERGLRWELVTKVRERVTATEHFSKIGLWDLQNSVLYNQERLKDNLYLLKFNFHLKFDIQELFKLKVVFMLLVFLYNF
jgi:hypothetical protein